MSRFDKVKDYYKKGLWSISMVRNAVIKGWITEDEFKIITDISYDEDSSGVKSVGGRY